VDSRERASSSERSRLSQLTTCSPVNVYLYAYVCLWMCAYWHASRSCAPIHTTMVRMHTSEYIVRVHAFTNNLHKHVRPTHQVSSAWQLARPPHLRCLASHSNALIYAHLDHLCVPPDACCFPNCLGLSASTRREGGRTCCCHCHSHCRTHGFFAFLHDFHAQYFDHYLDPYAQRRCSRHGRSLAY
jgi:hypothetical protein